MIRLSFLALLMAVIAASSTSAGDYAYNGHGHEHGHAASPAGYGAWHTGCCDQPNSCCEGWWDNYCAEKRCCKIKDKFAQYRSHVICNPAKTGCGAGCGSTGCGGCASRPCRHMHLPKLDLCLPKLEMPSFCLPTTNCGSCRGVGCGGCCGLSLPSISLPSFDLHSWRRPKACHGGCNSCGAPAAECGCGHGAAVDYNYAPEHGEHGEMLHNAPLPPTHHESSPTPADMLPAPEVPADAEPTEASDRSAALDAIRTLLP